MFKKIGRSDTLRHEVAEYIKKLIEQGKIKPGDRLPTEREMAEKFGVSRTVIRDAVKTLTGIGVLQVRHGVGIFAATPDSQLIAQQLSSLLYYDHDTISNLFEVRMVLETSAAGWAAERHSDEDLNKIGENLEIHQKVINKGDSATLGEIDRCFHMLVARSTKNPVTIRLMGNLLDLFQVSNRQTLSIPGRAMQSVQEHSTIFQAIAGKNKDMARENMKIHLLSILNSLQLKQKEQN